MWNVFNLTRPRNVESGLAEKLYIAPLSWLGNVATPHGPYLDAGDEVCIFDDHEFLPGNGFLEVRLLPDKNKYQTAPKGEKGALSFTHTLEVFIPGSYAMLHSVMAGLTNIPVIALAKDSSCGESWYYQYGTGQRHAYLIPTFTTGAETDAKGYTAQIAFNLSYTQLYFGAVQQFEADLQLMKPVFLAPQSFSGGLHNYTAVARAYSQRRITDIEAIFEAVEYLAGDAIVTIALANDKGFFETETYTEFPADNYGDFIAWLENWLLVNGAGRTLVEDNRLLKIKDSSTINCLLAIQVPDELLTGGGGVLELGGSLVAL